MKRALHIKPEFRFFSSLNFCQPSTVVSQAFYIKETMVNHKKMVQPPPSC